MRRSLCLLELCLLCIALARGVRIPFATERATLRPPDAWSTNDGFVHTTSSQCFNRTVWCLDITVGKQPSALTTASVHFSTEPVQNVVNEARSLLQSDAPGHDNTPGFKCNLTDEARDRYTLADERTWLISDAVLEEVDSDLQRIVNCAKDGDRIAFDVTRFIQPPSLVIIPWQLTLDTYVEDGSPYSKEKTRFTCPRENSGLFIVQTSNVTFVNLVVANCTFDGTEKDQSVIEVSQCHDRNSPGLVLLRGVAFRENRLPAASGLRMSESPCSDLEMVDVEIADNVCSSDGCGVLLANNSSLENCTVSGNQVVDSNKQPSSLLYAPALSNTTIQGFAASRNDLTVVRVRDGIISLSNASFNRNSLKTKHPERTKVSCIHSVNSSVTISACNFTANEGYNGSAVLAKKSNISVSCSFFWNNFGSLDGGCIYASKSNVRLENATATNSSAESGGFLYVENSDVTLTNTTATTNIAKNRGGFVYAHESNMSLKGIAASNNTALDDGGFVYAHFSNVSLEGTAADNNTALDEGGFMYARHSNATLENTEATGNHADDRGGFIYAYFSNLTLENTTAINNRAEERGGFVYAHESNMSLEKTTATDNGAEDRGGFIYAHVSNMTLENTTAINNGAEDRGGFVYAHESNMSLENTTATDNSAKYRGGFIYAHVSNMSLKNTTATTNSAKNRGGFVYAHESNMSLKGIAASNNTALDDGGFVYAHCSNVSLEGTAANNNTVLDEGGFMYAWHSNVTLENTEATGNHAAERGGFMYSRCSIVVTKNTTAINNGAEDRGGFIYAHESNMSLENTTATDNGAENRGGFIYAHVSNMSLKGIVASNNTALDDGGFVYAHESNMSLKDIVASNNTALDDGGFVYAWHSNATMENTEATGNHAEDRGGFIYAYFSNLTLENTTAINNSAEYRGGFVYADNSNMSLENTTATDNGAEDRGGFIYAHFSNVTLGNMNATGGFSTRGGVAHVADSQLTIKLSIFNSSAGMIMAGGFFTASMGSIIINDSSVSRGRSRSGGAFSLENSALIAHRLSVVDCEADDGGGGVIGRTSSTFLCVDCTFRNNSAGNGNGGAVLFETDCGERQSPALRLVKSQIKKNKAELGGGLFFASSEPNDGYDPQSKQCPVMALVDTQFSNNVAEVAGGAIFTSKLEAIHFSCPDTSSDSGLEVYGEEEWKDLRKIESVRDVCLGWKNNNAKIYGPVIGTYATAARLMLEDATNSVCVSGGDDCVIEEYRNGTSLPEATVTLLDSLKQGPARKPHIVYANMSSPSNEFLVGSVVLPMEDGTCTFRSIKGFVPQGEYKLTVDFGEKDIQEIGLTVKVQNCSFGDILLFAKFCVECSSTTFNFNTSGEVCQSCPENGNCTTQVITPNDGYWQKTPCSDELYRCLPTSACKFKDRSKNLTAAVNNVTSCDFNESWIEDNYTRIQCAEGHDGPLCGSCLSGYGSGLSSKCRKCLMGILDVVFILVSVLLLIGLTTITVKGTLNVRQGDVTEPRRQNALHRFIELSSPPPPEEQEEERTPPEEQEERANTDASSHHSKSPNDDSIEGLAASEAVLAKWKAVEVFKITLSFIQTIILLVSLNVGWSLHLLIVAEAAEYISGLAPEGNRRSIMCLGLEDPFEHLTALAFAFNICFVPVAVFFLWIVFWTVKAAVHGKDRPKGYLARRCMLSLMALWYITLVPVLKTALSIALCVDVDDSLDIYRENITRYWAVDTKIECYEDDHAKLLHFVVLAFVCPMYGGLLVVFALFLRTPVEHLRDKDGWVYETTGFLYRSYSLGRRRYWEVAIVLRKVAIGFLVFCAHLYDSVVPIAGVAHVITLAIVAQIVAKPYRKEFADLNRFDLASLFVSLVTTLIGITLRQEDFPEDVTRELSTAACLVLNLVTFAFFAYYNLKFLSEYLKHKLEDQNEDCERDWGVFKVLARWIAFKVKHTVDVVKKRFASSNPPDDGSIRS